MSALDCEGRTIWIVDAHRDDGKRFVVHAGEILTTFMELESATLAGRRIILTCGGIFLKRNTYENTINSHNSFVRLFWAVV